MEWMVEVVGWCGALTSSMLAAPQAFKLYRSPGEYSGVSLLTWCVVMLNALLWFLYAVWTAAYPVGVPSLINGPLAAYIIVKILLSKRRQRQNEAILDRAS